MKTNEQKTRVLVVDDHPVFRQGIIGLINQENDMAVCGQVENAREIIDSIKVNKPDIIVLDITLKEQSGVEALKNIKALYPKVKVLMLSMHEETIYAPRALRAGAAGYVMKQEALDNVVTAIRKVARNEIHISPQMSSRLLGRLTRGNAEVQSPVDALSDRELEVLTLIGQGFGTRAIAEKLNLSIKTIESHRAHVKEKLNLESGAELVHYAIRWVQMEGKVETSLAA